MMAQTRVMADEVMRNRFWVCFAGTGNRIC